MERPNEALIEQAIMILAESVQADIAVCFNPNPSQEEIAEAIRANAVWEDFRDSNPELVAYIDAMAEGEQC